MQNKKKKTRPIIEIIFLNIILSSNQKVSFSVPASATDVPERVQGGSDRQDAHSREGPVPRPRCPLRLREETVEVNATKTIVDQVIGTRSSYFKRFLY